jgi:hypothetical protein
MTLKYMRIRRNAGANPVLRGGAFNNTPRNARVAYRNNDHPNNVNDENGFRVVVRAHPSVGWPEMRWVAQTQRRGKPLRPGDWCAAHEEEWRGLFLAARHDCARANINCPAPSLACQHGTGHWGVANTTPRNF